MNIPTEEFKPLSQEEWQAFRRKEEAMERERIKRLREEYAAHAQEIREMELKRTSETDRIQPS